MFFKKRIPTPFSNKLSENMKSFSDGKVRYISYIFSVFSESNDNAKIIASKFFVKIIKENEFNKFIRIAEHMHGSYYLYYENPKWFNIKIDDLFTQEMSQDEKRAVLIVASFHSNGYLREEAIKELVNFPNTLQYILIRRNDWVNEVRNTARSLLKIKYNRLNNGELLSAIPAIIRLMKCERDNFKEEYDYFESFLLNNETELNKGLKSNEPKIRLFCAELVVKKNVKFDRLKQYIVHETIPYNRERIYHQYVKNLLDIDNDYLELMLNDRYSKIRIIALNYIYSKKLKSNNFVLGYLLDKNSNVRDMARYIIKQNDGTFSFRNFYLEELKKNNTIAIAGLGETGIHQDVVIVEKYLSDKLIKTVRMAIKALIKLDREKYVAKIMPLLNDERNGVVKDVATILSKESQLYEEEIRETFNKSINSYTKLKCAKLLFSVSKWNALNNIVIILNNDNIAISNLAKISLDKWIKKFNKSFVVLSDKQRETLINNISKITRSDINIQQILYYVN